jgi:hypothetical protein
MPIKLNDHHPKNRQVLQYLSRRWKKEAPSLLPPDQVKDPYYGQGSHPDIVERVWDQLGKALPVDCRCLVCGTPALVHPASGVILAICNGTQYNLRLPADAMQEAMQRGVRLETQWSTGEVMNAVEVLGPNWIFGGWLNEELRWCLEAYRLLEDGRDDGEA